MEQDKISFQTILSECITNPEGEIAKTQLSEDNQKTLDETLRFVKLLEENAEDLRQYHVKHHEKSAEEGAQDWANDRYEAIKRSRSNK